MVAEISLGGDKGFATGGVLFDFGHSVVIVIGIFRFGTVSCSFCGTDDNLDVSGLRTKRPLVDTTSRTFRSDGIEKSLCQQRALL